MEYWWLLFIYWNISLVIKIRDLQILFLIKFLLSFLFELFLSYVSWYQSLNLIHHIYLSAQEFNFQHTTSLLSYTPCFSFVFIKHRKKELNKGKVGQHNLQPPPGGGWHHLFCHQFPFVDFKGSRLVLNIFILVLDIFQCILSLLRLVWLNFFYIHLLASWYFRQFFLELEEFLMDLKHE